MKLLPSEEAEAQPARSITARDLIELSGTGRSTGASPLAVSPDGNSLAIVLTRADLDSNDYCSGLIVLSLTSGGKPRLLDSGGEFIPFPAYVRNLYVEVGLPAQLTPVWSADGRTIYYLKRRGGSTQIYAVAVDGSGARQVTNGASDVEILSASADRRHFLFAMRPTFAGLQSAIDREGRSGWLYDERVAANAGPRPRVEETKNPLQFFEADLDGKVSPTPISDDKLRATAATRSRAGWLVSSEREGRSLIAPGRLFVTTAKGEKIRCGSEACLGPVGVWWDVHGHELRFLRHEGWNHELSAFYRWRPGSGVPKRGYVTADVIQDCVAAGERLVCTTENATQPLRIELIDPVNGARQVLFDPNPQFRSIALGTVQRLRWRNDLGLEAWGDLVLPPGRAPGQKFPLILVQYNSRGFLRGGTGDEYPIFLLAQHGFAVLSFERPRDVAETMPDVRNEIEANAADVKNWAERRSIHSALITGIEAAIATGNVDPRRIGITGLSDGATGTRFALINSDRFAAAAISSCCVEPKTAMTYGGIAWAEFNRSVGYPPVNGDDTKFWKPASLALNAERIRTPLLMQLADEEFTLSLEAFEALREAHAPVELFVFPDEHHIKWQPVHRLAVYNRSLDWFDYWLNCREDPSPAKREQYRRWRALKANAKSVCN